MYLYRGNVVDLFCSEDDLIFAKYIEFSAEYCLLETVISNLFAKVDSKAISRLTTASTA